MEYSGNDLLFMVLYIELLFVDLLYALYALTFLRIVSTRRRKLQKARQAPKAATGIPRKRNAPMAHLGTKPKACTASTVRYSRWACTNAHARKAVSLSHLLDFLDFMAGLPAKDRPWALSLLALPALAFAVVFTTFFPLPGPFWPVLPALEPLMPTQGGMSS